MSLLILLVVMAFAIYCRTTNATFNRSNLEKMENKTESPFVTSVDDYSLEMAKGFGKFKLIKGTKREKIMLMQIAIAELGEVDKNGVKIDSNGHFYKTFANVSFNVSNETVVERYGLPALYRSISLSLNDNATLEIGCLLFKLAGTIKTPSGEEFPVKKGSFKFDISVKSWKFCGPDTTCMIKNQNLTASFLDIGLEVTGRNLVNPVLARNQKGKKPKNGGPLQTFQIEDGELIFPSMYRNGSGHWVNLDAEYPKMVPNGQKNIFLVRFPAYQSEYYYEPVAAEINNNKVNNSNVSFLNSISNVIKTSSQTLTPPDIETSFNNVSVQIRKQSGSMSMMRMRQNGVKEKVLDIKFNSIYEVDNAGNKIKENGHFINNFTDQPFVVSQQVTKIIKYGLNANVFIFALFLGNASVTVEFITFTTSGNITVESGELFYINAGTMKFNIIIRDWMFCGMHNVSCTKNINGAYLDLQLEMRAEKNGQEGKEPKLSNKVRGRKALKSKYSPSTYDVDQSTATFSKMVLINGNWTDMPDGYPRYEIQDKKKIFVIRFISSKSEMVYDPLIDVLPDSGASSSAKLMSGTLIAFTSFTFGYFCKL